MREKSTYSLAEGSNRVQSGLTPEGWLKELYTTPAPPAVREVSPAPWPLNCSCCTQLKITVYFDILMCTDVFLSQNLNIIWLNTHESEYLVELLLCVRPRRRILRQTHLMAMIRGGGAWALGGGAWTTSTCEKGQVNRLLKGRALSQCCNKNLF